MSEDELRAAIATVRTWYHVLELGDGVLTPGVYDMRPHVGRFGLPARLDGLSVLDVGAANGFFSFHFEALGAARVVAVDLPHITDHDVPRWYVAQQGALLGEEALARLEHDEVHGGFELARRVLHSRVERLLCRALDLPSRVTGRFDLVFCCNVLIQQRDPVSTVEALAAVLKPDGLLVLATPVDLTVQAASYATFSGDMAHAAWWIPSPVALERFARCAGFGETAWLGSFPVPTTTEPDRAGLMGVIHARRPAVAPP